MTACLCNKLIDSAPLWAPDAIAATVDPILMLQEHHSALPVDRFAETVLNYTTLLKSVVQLQPMQHRLPQSTSGYTEIINIRSTRVSFKTCTVQLGEVSVPLILDTAACSVAPQFGHILGMGNDRRIGGVRENIE